MPRMRRNRTFKTHVWDRVAKKVEVEKEELKSTDTGLIAGVQIKTEVLDSEENMETSMPDITIETHESVEELRRVLNLPDTQMHREPVTIKSEEYCLDEESSLRNDSLAFSNTVQSASDSYPQLSNQKQTISTDNTVIGPPNFPESPCSEKLNLQNVYAIKREDNWKYPIIEISELNNADSGVATNKVCRSEADHPLTQICNTSLSCSVLNPTFCASESEAILGLNKDQFSAMMKAGLKEKIRRRRQHNEIKKKTSDRKGLVLNIPYFKSIKYDPDLNFLLSLMPFLKSLSPCLRSKARAQIKEMILDPGLNIYLK